MFVRNKGNKTFPLGQGLLETVIAIGVIVTGVVGSLALIISTLSAGQQSADQLVASNIAWEGVEVVKNIRDNNFLAAATWDAGLTGGDTTAIAVFDDAANTWTLNFSPNVMTDAGAQMYRSAGIYRQNVTPPAGSPTNFYRIITIDPVGTDYQKRVVSEVRWVEKGVNRSVLAETNLYNWR